MVTYPSIPAQAADNIYSAVLQEYSSEVKAQTFNNMPAVERLWRNKGKGTGGNGRHEWRLRAGRNTNAKMIKSDADGVDFSQQSNLITAWFDYMATFAVPVQQSILRDAIASGPNAIVDLAKEDMRQAEETLRYMISTQTFGDGSDKTLIGLNALLPTTGVGTNTLFNVAEANAVFWRNYFLTSAGSWASNGLFGSSDDKITRAYLTCSDNGAQTPNLIISDRSVVEYYIRSEGRTRSTTKRADFAEIGRGAITSTSTAGAGLPFYDAEWVWDVECPTGRAYLVNTADFELVEDPNFNFKWLGPIPLGKQIFLKGRVLVYRAQSKAYRRNRSGVTDGWTA
jgi:hypothetical protein